MWAGLCGGSLLSSRFWGDSPAADGGVFIKAVNSKCYYFVESVVSVLLTKIAGYSAVKLNLL